MPDWIRDQKEYPFVTRDGLATRLYVFGAMDESGEERAQIVLENHPDNKGRSVESERGQVESIAAIAKDMGVKPTDADWFVKDDEGEIRAIDVKTVEETISNRQFEAFKRNGEFSIHGEAEAKKAFPDEVVDRTEVSARAPSEGELTQLEGLFGQDGLTYQEPARKVEPTNDVPKDVPKSAHEFNLADESFRP